MNPYQQQSDFILKMRELACELGTSVIFQAQIKSKSKKSEVVNDGLVYIPITLKTSLPFFGYK